MGDKVRRLIEYHESRIRESAPQQAPAPQSNAQQQDLLARQGPGRLERKDFWKDLEGKLGETGRVDPTSEESLAKREQWSGTILQGMEKSTRERQTAQGATSLAHGVFGHGPGTDQVSRLVHGRRNDELLEDRDSGAAPTTQVSLTGNPNGLDDTVVEAYGKVGSDPNNTSGAFTSNVGMLHVVESAFSQAALLSSDQQQRRARGEGATLDEERFVPTVGGPGEGIGYTLSLDGTSRQEKGDDVSPETMQERFEHMKRTDGMKNATMVLDPAFVGTGPDRKRAGWQLQTAFPNDQELTPRLDAPQDVERMLALRAALAAVEEAKTRLADAEKALGDMKSKIANLESKVLEGIRTGLKKAKEQNKSTEALEKRLAEKEEEHEKMKNQCEALETARDTAQADLTLAEAERDRLKST